MAKLCFMCMHRLMEDQLHHARNTNSLMYRQLDWLEREKKTVEDVRIWLKNRSDDINEHSQARVLAGCDHPGSR